MSDSVENIIQHVLDKLKQEFGMCKVKLCKEKCEVCIRTNQTQAQKPARKTKLFHCNDLVIFDPASLQDF